MRTHGARVGWALLVLAGALNGCSPSLPYQGGRGFYSEDLLKAQVQQATASGKVKSLGPFSVEAGGCFNYSEAATERKVVFPAVKQRLKEMGANAAHNIAVKEKWYDYLLGALIVPGFLGCNNWEITGEALQVDQTGVKGPTG